MRFKSQIAGLAGLVLWLVGIAPGAIPQSPESTTYEAFTEARRRFNHATLVDEYLAHGSRDPRWDAQAEAFLRAAAEYWGGPTADRTEAAADRIIPLGDEAIAAGCDDPLVTYVWVRVGGDSSSRDWRKREYAPRIRAAAPAIIKRGYHGLRCFTAAQAWLDVIPKGDAHAQERAAIVQTVREQIVRAMTQTRDPFDQRVLWSYYINDVDDWQTAELEALRDAILAEPEASTWLRDSTLGLIHVELAWKARGSGWANTVSDEGWRGFEENLRLARERLTAAWEENRAAPEAAAAMIKVAMGSSEQPEVEMRMWFDRAVTAQFDFAPAYNNLLWGLMPRWHGSHAARFAFGVECAETGRFDTEVPWELIDILVDSRADSSHNRAGNDGYDLWRQLNAYPHVKKVLQSYKGNGAQGARWRQSIQLGFAWGCGEWDEAVELIAALGDGWDPQAERKLGVGYEKIVFEVASHRGPHAEAISRAWASAREGRLADAAEEFDAIPLDELQPAALKQAVRDRVQALRWRVAFDRGMPVDLLADGLAGWDVLIGEWEAGDRAIVARSGFEMSRLVTVGRFGDSWELSGRAEFDPRSTGPLHPVVIILGHVKWKTSPVSVRISPGADRVDVGWIWRDGYSSFPAAVPEPSFSFRVRMRDGVVDVWVEDQLVVEGHPAKGYDADADNRPGIGLSYKSRGATWTFRDLVLRQARPGPARPPGAPPAPR